MDKRPVEGLPVRLSAERPPASLGELNLAGACTRPPPGDRAGPCAADGTFLDPGDGPLPRDTPLLRFWLLDFELWLDPGDGRLPRVTPLLRFGLLDVGVWLDPDDGWLPPGTNLGRFELPDVGV